MADNVVSPEATNPVAFKKPKTKAQLEELNHQLSFAAERGNFELAKTCIDEGADINAKGLGERTPLWTAIFWNRRNSNKIVALLLDNDAEIETPDSDGETPLWRAIAEGNEQNIELLLERGANPNAKDKSGTPILQQAITRTGNVKIVKRLLDAEADIEVSDSYGQTPLWMAAESGNVEIFELLLGRNARVNVKDRSGTSVLLAAVSGENTGIVELLLKAGADIEAPDNNGTTPLWRAVEKKSISCVDLLLSHNANIKVRDKNNRSMLLQAAEMGHQEILRFLLFDEKEDIESKDESGKSVLWHVISSKNQDCIDLVLEFNPNVNLRSTDDSSLFHVTAEVGNEKMLQFLLDKTSATKPVDWRDSDGHTPLWFALSSRNQGCVDLLFRQDPNLNIPDKKKQNLLHQAARFSNEKAMELLVKNGIPTEDTDEFGRTVLWIAVDSRNIGCVKILLGSGANTDAQDSEGVSILHAAVRNSDLEMVRLLLRDLDPVSVSDNGLVRAEELSVEAELGVSNKPQHLKPNPNTKSNDGESPLLSAVKNKSLEMVTLLIGQGAKLGAFDGDGDSELGRASYHGSKDIVKELLNLGANIDKSNQQGLTPLHWAAWSGNTAVGELLLANHCEIAIADKNGETPFYYAICGGSLEFVKLLLDTSAARSTTKLPKGPKPGGRSTINLEAKFACGGTALHIAASKGREDVVELLLNKNVNVNALNKKKAFALHVAVEEDKFSCAEKLLARMNAATIGVKNCDGDTVLHLACRRSNQSMVEKLLAKIPRLSRDIVAEKNINNETPLSIAANERALRILQLLINYEADIRYSDEDDPYRKWAIMEDLSHDVSAIGELLDDEQNWYNGDETRIKTLYWAARNGYVSLVQKILVAEKTELEKTKTESGEDKSKSSPEVSKPMDEPSDLEDEEMESAEEKSTSGKTLYWAAVGGQTATIKLLVQMHKDFPDLTSEKAAGRAIQAAARNGHEGVVRQLIRDLVKLDKETFSRGNDNDLSIIDSWTPLHWVINYKPKEAVDAMRYMLMHGADPETSGGRSATSMAEELATRFPEDTQYDTLLGLLQSPLRIPPKPMALRDPASNHPREADIVCKNFYSNIVDFYTSEGRFFTLERKSLVNKIIYSEEEGPDTVMNDAKKKWKLDDINLADRLRWIHLPANNWIWAEDLMTRIASESRKSAPEYTRLSKFVDLNKREHLGKPQCRFMYPSLAFESRDFHSGEGVNIPKLQAEARRRKKDRVKSEQIASSKGDPAVDHTEATGKGRDTSKQRGNDKPSAKGNEAKDPVQPLPTPQQGSVVAPKSAKQDPDDKSTAPEKTATSHLNGSRLSLCIPYVTFQMVRSHRALRQAIRLADAVQQKKKLQTKEARQDVLNQESPQTQIAAEKNAAQELLEVDAPAERLLRQEAREEILEVEIAHGLILLGNPRTKFYDDLYILADKTVSEIREGSSNEEQGLEEWLNLLKATHKRMRRSNKLCTSHTIMEWLERFFDAIEIVQQGENNKANSPVHEQLLEYYLDPDNSKGLHASRTLDQYYYAALEDTSRRDIDQVVRRFQARKVAEDRSVISSGIAHRSPRDRANAMAAEAKRQEIKRPEAKENDDNGWEDDPNAQIAMVDQLWLWIIDDETVITCFPGSWDLDGTNSNRVELLDTIRKHIHTERRPQISSIYHLATIITSLCVGYVEHCKANLDHCKDSFLHMFASSIGIAADEEVKCFETFKTDLRQSTDNETVQLNIVKEITLLEEIKDIRDELNILRSIFEDQRALLGKLLNLVAKPQGAGMKTTENDPILHYYQERSDIDLRIEKVEKMDIDAAKTYDSINHLLDLRQKNANLYEAVQAREQAEQGRKQAEQASIQADKATQQAAETVKQGRIILVFTLVTIIFLPLSSLTSLYALNVESFPHVDDNFIYPSEWIFPRIFGTSVAIAIPLVWIAIYINSILDWYKDNIIPKWAEFKQLIYFCWKEKFKPFGRRDRQEAVVSEGKCLPPTSTPSQIESQTVDSKSDVDIAEKKVVSEG